MKTDILRACGFGRKAAGNLIGGAGATNEVIQKAAVKALTNMENEKAAIEEEKRYGKRYKSNR